MTKRAVLAYLVDGLEEQSDTLFPFLDTETGEVVLMQDETLSMAEEDPAEIESLQGWQKEDAQLALSILTTDRYLQLPARFDVDEYRIMRDFCDEVESDKARAALQSAMQGQRAFRRFKDTLFALNLMDSWHIYRRNAFEEILRTWCEEHGITLIPKGENPVEQGSLNF